MPAIACRCWRSPGRRRVMRLAGMTLPGNGWPVSGSRITVLSALKSPPRIAVVGSVRSVGVVEAVDLLPLDAARRRTACP